MSRQLSILKGYRRGKNFTNSNTNPINAKCVNRDELILLIKYIPDITFECLFVEEFLFFFQKLAPMCILSILDVIVL